MISIITDSTMALRPRAPVFRVMAMSAMALTASSVKVRSHVVELQARGVLAHYGVFRLQQDAHQVVAFQIIQGYVNGQATHEFGDQPETAPGHRGEAICIDRKYPRPGYGPSRRTPWDVLTPGFR
jgi:hypothetical protein